MKNPIVNDYVFSTQELDQMAALLIGLKDQVDVYTFTGPLGAGKTTLIGAMLRLQGVQGPITSPTFALLQTYTNAQAQHFNHFDLYRISSVNEFIESGLQEYLYAPDSWAFIEWPGVICSLLDRRVCAVSLDYVTDTQRRLKFSVIA